MYYMHAVSYHVLDYIMSLSWLVSVLQFLLTHLTVQIDCILVNQFPTKLRHATSCIVELVIKLKQTNLIGYYGIFNKHLYGRLNLT